MTLAAGTRVLIPLLGMHRSGTSFAARALAEAGLPMGPALMRDSVPDNRDGYWEDAEIVAVQSALEGALTAQLGARLPTDAAALADWPAGWLDAAPARDAAARLEAILAARFTGSSAFGFKDPRTTRLLPLWRRVADRIGARLEPLLLVRAPAEAARSFAGRNGLDLAVAQLHWARATSDVLLEAAATAPAPPLVIAYDDWFAAPQRPAAAMAALFAACGLGAPGPAPAAESSQRHQSGRRTPFLCLDRAYEGLAACSGGRLDPAAAAAARGLIASLVAPFGGWVEAATALRGAAGPATPGTTLLPLDGARSGEAPGLMIRAATRWCGAVDGRFRLHARPGADAPAALIWRGATARIARRFAAQIWLPADSAQALRWAATAHCPATGLEVATATGRIEPGGAAEAALPLPATSSRLVDIALSVLPTADDAPLWNAAITVWKAELREMRPSDPAAGGGDPAAAGRRHFPSVSDATLALERRLAGATRDLAERRRLDVYEILSAACGDGEPSAFTLEEDVVLLRQAGAVIAFPRPLPMVKHGHAVFGYARWLSAKYAMPGFVEVEDGDVVIDCGAYVGGFALGAAARAARVVAFEPEARNWACAARNLASFPSVRVERMALWSRDGEASLNIARSSVEHSLLRPDDGAPVEVLPTRVARLDSYCAAAGLGTPDLVKVEAEGAEPEVIEGLGSLRPRKIAIDVSPERDGLSPADEIAAVLRGRGYALALRGHVLFALREGP